MIIIAVDDEPLALQNLTRILREADPSCAPYPFHSPQEALTFAAEHPVDVALLDIAMPEMDGLACARALKDMHPDVKIIFVTSYEHYAVDAFAVKATGYLLKPARVEDMRRELTFAYGTPPVAKNILLKVQTFGGFEVFAGEKPLAFKRAKAKELLALLVDRHGGGVSARETSAVLWENMSYGPTQRSYYQTAVAELRKTLDAAGASDVLVKSWNSLAIDPTRIDCDSYRFAAGDPQAINSYRHDYLPAYAWAELSIGTIESSAAQNASRAHANGQGR